MTNDRHDRISERAYALWQKEGSPGGRDREFWERAESMDREDLKPVITTPLQKRTAADQEVDKAIADTFPASDPPAFTVTSGAKTKQPEPVAAAGKPGPNGKPGTAKRRGAT